jgi:ketosteroid isomerase-like protein
MTLLDPMAVAVDWLDAYRAARINQIVGMYSLDAVIDCACNGQQIVHGQEGVAAYWRQRFIESPALELVDLQVDGHAVVVIYKIRSGTVEALLEIGEDGLITGCSCGPVSDVEVNRATKSE